jgi:hypothetical protein
MRSRAILLTLVTLTACVSEPTHERSRSQLSSRDASTLDASPRAVGSSERGEETPEFVIVGPRADLDALLNDVERAAGIPLPGAWARTSVEDMMRAAHLVREIMPVEQRNQWSRDIDLAIERDDGISSSRPTAAQIAAIAQLANESVSDLRVQWNFETGSPSRLDNVGYVNRSGAASTVWEGFVRERQATLVGLFDDSILTDAEVVEVDPTPGPFDIVRVLRRRGGLRIDHDHLDVYVSNDHSTLGRGVLTRIVGRWNLRVPDAFERLRRRGFLTESEIRARVGGDALSATLDVGCSDVCYANWRVLRTFDEEILFDAVTGEETRRIDPRHQYSGTVRQLGVPPEVGGALPIRMRGARGRAQCPAVHLSRQHLAVGRNIQHQQSASWAIDLCGATPAGTWPVGRVDRRVFNDWTTIVSNRVAWSPVSAPNPNFGSPDAWPSNASDLRHGQEIVYGWYSYWQYLFKDVIGCQVPDTFKFELNPSGMGGGSTGNYDFPVPGSGQTNHASSTIGWSADDSFPTDPSTVTRTVFLLGHEFTHGIQGCIANPGAPCQWKDPGQQNYRPPGHPELWRRVVYDAYAENFANMVSLILGEFRYPVAPADYAINWKHNWRYGGYFDSSDDFANPIEDSIGTAPSTAGYDCHVPGAPSCLATHDCVVSEESGVAPPSAQGSICRRRCTAHTDCPTPPWPNEIRFCADQSYCQQYGYKNDWFSTVGTRLAFDLGWKDALKLMVLAASGAHNNGIRDFNVGSDTWYDHLAD